MSSNQGGHEDRESGDASANLAAELRRVILELDADQYPQEQPTQPAAQPQETQPRREDEVQDEHPNLAASVKSLKHNLEEVSAESMVALRLLHEVTRLHQVELLSNLARMEQSLQDEINLMEKRIRGDIAALRSGLAIRAPSETEEQTDASS